MKNHKMPKRTRKDVSAITTELSGSKRSQKDADVSVITTELSGLEMTDESAAAAFSTTGRTPSASQVDVSHSILLSPVTDFNQTQTSDQIEKSSQPTQVPLPGESFFLETAKFPPKLSRGCTLKASAEYAKALSQIPRSQPAKVPAWIRMPIICPAGLLNARFRVEGNAVVVMLREIYWTLKSVVLRTELDRSTIYVVGPMGVGKSHLLYLLAWELPLISEKYRVTYIHDCELWRYDDVEYVMHALMMTFYGDVPDFEVHAARAISAANDRELKNAVKILENSILTILEEQGLRWFIICDQYNALNKDSVTNNAPFNMLFRLEGQATIILSATANNEGYLDRPDSWYTHDVGVRTFSDAEFNVWCEHYGYDSKVQDVQAAFFLTGGLPLELQLFHASKGDLGVYEGTRTSEILRNHSEFFRKLRDMERRSFLGCLASLELEIPCLDSTCLDRRFMEISGYVVGGGRVMALSPLYLRAIRDYHRSCRHEEANKAALTALSGDLLTNDAKGRVIEKLIILSMEEGKHYCFKGEKMQSEGKVRGNSKEKNMFRGVVDQVMRFDGNNVPSELCPRIGTTLLIPNNPNYPGADFLIWDAVKNLLLAGQITVSDSVIDYVPTTEKKQNTFPMEAWSLFFEIETKNICFLWLTPDACVKRVLQCVVQNQMKHWLVRFSSFQGMCTAVQSLRLKPPTQ